MANCFDYSICDELATIGFMRSLIPDEISSCVLVSSGTTASTCCGDMLEANYVPRLSEISGQTFARLRVTNLDPSDDVNGFTYTVPTLIQTNCFTGDTLGNEALMKSQIAFEYTSATTCEHIVTSYPTCGGNLNYGLIVRKKWERHKLECDYESSGNIKDTITEVVTETTESGYLERKIDEAIGFDNTYIFSFVDKTIESETNAQCGDSISASTTFSLPSYTVDFYVMPITETITCEADTYTFVATSGVSCFDDDIVLDITIEYGESIGHHELNGVNQSCTVYIPHNSSTASSTTVKVTIVPIIGGERRNEIIKIYERELCGWTPLCESTPCGVFSIEPCSWDNQEKHEYEHSC